MASLYDLLFGISDSPDAIPTLEQFWKAGEPTRQYERLVGFKLPGYGVPQKEEMGSLGPDFDERGNYIGGMDRRAEIENDPSIPPLAKRMLIAEASQYNPRFDLESDLPSSDKKLQLSGGDYSRSVREGRLSSNVEDRQMDLNPAQLAAIYKLLNGFR